MRKCANISSYMRRTLVIYDFAPDPLNTPCTKDASRNLNKLVWKQNIPSTRLSRLRAHALQYIPVFVRCHCHWLPERARREGVSYLAHTLSFSPLTLAWQDKEKEKTWGLILIKICKHSCFSFVWKLSDHSISGNYRYTDLNSIF